MTIKLTIQQAEALRNLFESVIIPDKPREMEDKLVYVIMIGIYKKLRAKLEARLKGAGYSLTLNDVEAMAYYVYFKDRALGNNYIYETTFMFTHIAQIDKAYA